ncbi:MAG: winged helix-turn-helix transcriptional regulator [Candidatus Dadabacteria bacterium]|nr:winged helix-turn-helix transcriptional regulator [Candidatus Dadabacteria bacterium]NIT13734.1 winged helix-turn-helix transcriptional regulator [Candidatus Dadabacteria bacterium]
MIGQEISSVMEDYIKAIFNLLQKKGKANTNDLAKSLKVSAPTVTQMIKRLVDLKLVKHEPYKGVVLTESGNKIALETIRHHRLIEQYLYEALGVPWDKVHGEAEKLEHVISEDLEKRIAEALNHPTHDPHGSPIPSKDLVLENEDLCLLTELNEGDKGTISEVPDEDPELLIYLDDLGLKPETAFTIQKIEPYGGSVVLKIENNDIYVGSQAASQIRVKLGQ